MLPAPRRRDVLHMLLTGAAGLALPRYARAQQRPDASHHAALTATRLSDSVMLVPCGGNVLVVTSPDGPVLINGGAQERSPELLKMIADQSGGKRVVALFNTD